MFDITGGSFQTYYYSKSDKIFHQPSIIKCNTIALCKALSLFKKGVP